MNTDSAPGVLQRAFLLLRTLAIAGSKGMSLSEMSARCGYAHATVHRLLRQLVDEGMVVQLPDSRGYALGPVAFELGLAASPHDMRALSRALLTGLAERTQDSVFLSQRSFDEAVCIDLQPGPSPVRIVTLEIGSRRPLGAGAGGLAILGAMTPADRSGVIARVGDSLEKDWGITPAVLRASLAHFDTEGYALIRNRVHAGVSAVGVPVTSASGLPIAALSIAALNERLGPSNIVAVVKELRAAAGQLQRQVRVRRGRASAASD
jgi:DNA-binding IclR family transcriptional regulator